MKDLKIALIGAGGIGKIWSTAFPKASGVELAAVVDTDPKKAEEIASKSGAKVFTDHKAALAHPEIDAVVVAAPHVLLAPISKDALRAGKHVLCEKPAGINSSEIEENLAIAKEKNLTYMIGFNHRYHPAYLKAREAVDAGAIGKLLTLRARYGFGGRPGYEKEWRFDKKISGGGELIDQGAHMIDIARWFLGDFTDIKGFAENLYWGGEVEDNGFLLLRTAQKQVAQIHVSWTNWEWVHSIEIFGDKGYIEIDGLDKRYRGPERITIGKVDPKSGKFPEETKESFESESKEDSFARELTEFSEVIAGAKPLAAKPEDVIAVLKIVERIYAEK